MDNNYPKENRSGVEEIHLGEPTLEGELDLGDFTYELYGKGIKVFISPQIDETKLTFKNKPEKVKIIKQVQAQEYTNKQYPTYKEREKLTELDISRKDLQGDLDLVDFVSLEKLDCWDNKLSSLNIKNCSLLEEIRCHDSPLINLILPPNLTNLKILSLNYNNFQKKDLSFLQGAVNLVILNLAKGNLFGSLEFLKEMRELQALYINDTEISGSLEPLKNLSKLVILDIRNTDIDSGLEYLPDSLKEFKCLANKRKDARCQNIYNLFVNEYGEIEANGGGSI